MLRLTVVYLAHTDIADAGTRMCSRNMLALANADVDMNTYP